MSQSENVYLTSVSTPSGPPQEWVGAMGTICGEAVLLLHDRRMYCWIRDMITRNPALPKQSFVYQWIMTSYVAAAATAVRRLVDMTRGTISLRRLLEQIAAKPTAITRAWFVDRYNPMLRTIPPGRQRSSADRDFDELTDTRGAHVSADVVKRDCKTLIQASTAIKRFADECIAHRTARPTTPPPTYADLEKAIDAVAQIADRYTRLLGVGRVMEPAVPEALEAVFQVPWYTPLTDDGAS